MPLPYALKLSCSNPTAQSLPRPPSSFFMGNYNLCMALCIVRLYK